MAHMRSSSSSCWDLLEFLQEDTGDLSYFQIALVILITHTQCDVLGVIFFL